MQNRRLELLKKHWLYAILQIAGNYAQNSFWNAAFIYLFHIAKAYFKVTLLQFLRLYTKLSPRFLFPRLSEDDSAKT